MPKTLIPPNRFAEETPPNLEALLEALKASAANALVLVQNAIGRKDRTASQHADLCGIEMALVEFRSALSRRV
jgi:hypothetical protein